MKYLVTAGTDLIEKKNISLKHYEASNEKDLFFQIENDLFRGNNFGTLSFYFRKETGKLIWHWVDWACVTIFEFYYEEIK